MSIYKVNPLFDSRRMAPPPQKGRCCEVLPLLMSAKREIVGKQTPILCVNVTLTIFQLLSLSFF